MRILRSSFILFLIVVLGLPVFAQQPKPPKKVNFIPLPLVGYNNSIGFKLGASLTLIHPVSKNDSISPPSRSALMGYYTTNDSWFLAGFQQLFIRDDNYRVFWALGGGNINFQYYEDDLIPGGAFVDYSTARKFAVLSGKRRIVGRLYLGLALKFSEVSTSFDVPDQGQTPDSLKRLNGFGLPLTYDSRDNIFSPSRGINLDAKFISNVKWMGSDLSFQTFDIKLNGYNKMNERGLIAWRATIYTGLGEVPFEGEKAVGRTDIRGYSSGEFRGEQVYTAQGEYRYKLPKRWGLVGFFGLAYAYNSKNSNPGSGILPGAGAGVRWMAVEDRKINIGLDVAVGKGDYGIYFRLGEAF